GQGPSERFGGEVFSVRSEQEIRALVEALGETLRRLGRRLAQVRLIGRTARRDVLGFDSAAVRSLYPADGPDRSGELPRNGLPNRVDVGGQVASASRLEVSLEAERVSVALEVREFFGAIQQLGAPGDRITSRRLDQGAHGAQLRQGRRRFTGRSGE